MRLASIAKPDFKSEKITSLQTADEIRQQLQRAEYNSRPFSRRLAKFFKKGNDYDTCKFVWQWLVNNIDYDREPADKQTAKTIERFIVDGFGDCKHYSTTATGILNACGIPAEFVLVGQTKGVKRPNHAYCEAVVDGKEVVIDPCRRKKFDDECTHFYKWKYKPIKTNEIMALHYLSGDEIGRTKGKKGRQMRKASRKSSRQKTKKKIKDAADRVIKKVKKVGVAPSRAAFLAIVTLNAAKTATKLARVWNSPGGKEDLIKVWEGVGGDKNALMKAIAKGAKSKIGADDTSDANSDLDSNSGGSEGDGTAATIAHYMKIALPILKQFLALFKKHKAEGSPAEAKDFDAKYTQAKTDLANDPDIETSEVSLPKNKEVGLVKYSGGSGSQASFFSPLGLFFKTLLMLPFIHTQNAGISLLIAFVAMYCAVGMIIFPFYQWNWLNLRKFVSPFIELPKKIFYGTIEKIRG